MHVAPTPFGLGVGPVMVRMPPPPLRPLPARDCFHLAGAGGDIVFLRGHTDTVAARVFLCGHTDTVAARVFRCELAKFNLVASGLK